MENQNPDTDNKQIQPQPQTPPATIETTPASTPTQPPAPATPVPTPAPQPEQSYTIGVAHLPAEPVKAVEMSTLVLAWLTYAFWGWTVLALSILTGSIITSFMNESSVNGFTPYGIAALLVLLPIAFLCDTFYIKKEAKTKKGAELAISAIHAVIFALFGVGSCDLSGHYVYKQLYVKRIIDCISDCLNNNGFLCSNFPQDNPPCESSLVR